MAAFALTDTKVYVGALDQSCFADTVSLERVADTVEVTTFCSGGWREFVAGLKSWQATFGGPQDLAATAASATHTPDEYYTLNVGTVYPVMFVPTSDAEGAVAYGSQATLSAYVPLAGSVGDAAKHNIVVVPATPQTPLVRGVYATKQTATATGNGTGHQVGSVSATQSVYAGIHFLTRGGTTSTTVVLESDDNAGFTSATTRATFTAATSRTAQWTSVAGAITDDYWRFRWTISGSSPSVQLRGFIGIQ